MGSIYLALFTLKEYFRATFLYLETLLLAVVLFFFGKQFWELGAGDVFPVLGFFALALTLVSTLRITGRETNPRIYSLMTKKLSRITYLCGKALAVFLLDGLYVLGLFVLAFAFTKLGSELTLAAALLRLVPILLVIILTESVFLLFSALVLSRTVFIAGIVLSVLGVNQPDYIPVSLLLSFKQLMQSSYIPGSFGVESGLLTAFYIVLLFALACLIFSRRELDYKSK